MSLVQAERRNWRGWPIRQYVGRTVYHTIANRPKPQPKGGLEPALKREPRMKLSDAARARMRDGLKQATAVQVKLFLRYCGLPAGTNDTHEQVIDRVVGYVEEDKLAAEAVYQAVVEFPEFRNKHVYLYRAENTIKVDRDRFTRIISSWDQARIVAKPSEPRENYSFIDASRIRVCFSEVHRRPRMDLENDIVVWEEISRVVVLDADRASGSVSLAFDPHGSVTPRGAYHLSNYYGYYRARAEALLGTQMTPIPLHKALQSVEKSDLVRIRQGQSTTEGGSVRLTADVDDMRNMQAFKTVSPKLLRRESGRYIWLPDHSSNDGSDGIYLVREVHTDIDAPTGMVRFTKDSVSQEVSFVLRELLANA